MVQRIPRLNTKNSFFLFGARGAGKSTLIDQKYRSKKGLEKRIFLWKLNPVKKFRKDI